MVVSNGTIESDGTRLGIGRGKYKRKVVTDNFCQMFLFRVCGDVSRFVIFLQTSTRDFTNLFWFATMIDIFNC